METDVEAAARLVLECNKKRDRHNGKNDGTEIKDEYIYSQISVERAEEQTLCITRIEQRRKQRKKYHQEARLNRPCSIQEEKAKSHYKLFKVYQYLIESEPHVYSETKG